MERKVLDTLVREGQALAEKRTWLKKGYEQLLEKINGELSNIPDMEEADISYTIREFPLCPNYYEPVKRKINVKLIFKGDAYIQMRLGKEENYWVFEDLDDPSIATIRAFGEQLPFFLGHFLDEIKKRNAKNQEAIAIIQRLLEKLS